MLPLDLILWYWILGLPMDSPPMEKPPVEATQAAFPDAPVIDEFGGRWKLPGFTRVKPLTYKDADPLKGAHPVQMSGKPVGMPKFPLEAIEYLFGPFPKWDGKQTDVYIFVQGIWLVADEAPGVYLILNKGRWAVVNSLTAKPYPYLHGNADQTYRMPAIRTLTAKVTEVMATRGITWP